MRKYNLREKKKQKLDTNSFVRKLRRVGGVHAQPFVPPPPPPLSLFHSGAILRRWKVLESPPFCGSPSSAPAGRRRERERAAGTPEM